MISSPCPLYIAALLTVARQYYSRHCPTPSRRASCRRLLTEQPLHLTTQLCNTRGMFGLNQRNATNHSCLTCKADSVGSCRSLERSYRRSEAGYQTVVDSRTGCKQEVVRSLPSCPVPACLLVASIVYDREQKLKHQQLMFCRVLSVLTLTEITTLSHFLKL